MTKVFFSRLGHGHLLALLLLELVLSCARAAEVIPPAPRNHFNDYAGIVPRATAQSLNRELEQFERTTSNQIVVAIFPHMQSDSSIEDYTVRVAQMWGVGQRDRKNGAVLFIFSQDRKLYLQVGYGLEGVLPDALCKRIIANEITPSFRNGNFTGGVVAGVHAILAATRGEYRGNGRTAVDGDASNAPGYNWIALAFILIVGTSILVSRLRNFSLYSSRGFDSPWPISSGWNSDSSDRSSDNDRDSFSGGGGSFGGGGAGGSW